MYQCKYITVLTVLCLGILPLRSGRCANWIAKFHDTSFLEKGMQSDAEVRVPLYRLFGSAFGDSSASVMFDPLVTVRRSNLQAQLYLEELGLTRIYRIRCDPVSGESHVLRNLSPHTEYLERDGFVTPAYVPNDSLFPLQWGLDKIIAPDAWEIERGDEEIAIGILDTGVDWDHPDLFGVLWVNSGEDRNANDRIDPADINGVDDDHNGYIDDIIGWDFVDVPIEEVWPGEDAGPPDWNPMDFYGHGTQCGGIIVASTDNEKGVAGTGWHTRLISLRTMYKDNNGEAVGSWFHTAKAIVYAVEMGARIISMSFGGEYSQVVRDAIDYADSLGVLAVAAAHNFNSIDPVYPAALENVVAVAATDWHDRKTYFSNYGEWIDICAPGLGIYSTHFDDTYFPLSGTSMSTPNVSGVAALIASHTPAFTDEELRGILLSSADPIDEVNPEFKGLLGYGRLNAYRALSAYETPILRIHASALEEAEGNGDGEVDPGEKGHFMLFLKNTWHDAFQVHASISTDDRWITIVDSSACFPDIPQDSISSNVQHPFTIVVDESCPAPHSVSIGVDIHANDDYVTYDAASFAITGEPAFREVGGTARIRDGGVARGSCWGDFNGDGLLDLIVTRNHERPLLYINTGEGTFEERAPDAGLCIEGDDRSPVAGDFDNDGDLDIYIVRYLETNSLYCNDGSGRFADIASTAGVDDSGRGQDAAILDYDGDGDLDIYLLQSNEPNRLFSNNDDGAFQDIAHRAGIDDSGRGMSVGVGDYNSDGKPDICVVRGPCANILYSNNGDSTFTDIAARAGVQGTGNKIGALWGDFDNDLAPDLFITVQGEPGNMLFMNRGDSTFADRSDMAKIRGNGLHTASCTADYDNDGFLDIYLSSFYEGRNILLHNGGGVTFDDVSESSNTADSASSVTCIFGDYDSNGFPDIFVGNGGYAPEQFDKLFSNCGTDFQWIGIHLEGTVSNRQGTGCRIILCNRDGCMYRYANGDAAFTSMNSNAVHFGLENDNIADAIFLYWPSGIVDTLTSVRGGRYIHVVEGEGMHCETSARSPESPGGNFHLYQNVPNPFNPFTEIRFDIPNGKQTSMFAVLSIFNITGELVARPVMERLAPGPYTIVWDGRDSTGRYVSSGIYYCKLELPHATAVRKMVLLK
jgi:hypothetical protein